MSRLLRLTMLAVAITTVGLPAAADAAGAQPSAEVRTVTSDGRVMGVPSSTRTGDAGFAGTDVLAAPSGSASVDRIGPLLAANPESIIGADNRIKVADTTKKPARLVALITYGGSQWCTGFLIGNHTLATAGHCVYDTGTNQFLVASQLRVYPGYDGSKVNKAPFGSCGVNLLVSNTGYTVNHSDEYDYGALRLTCTVGNQTGWFGWWYQTTSLDGTQSRNNSYPGDKPLTQWKSTDQIRLSQARRLYYGNDTVGGSSGSPIFTKRPSGSAQCSGWCVMAVHGYGLYGSYPNNTWNHGARVTKDVSDAFLAWRSL
jgi:glutamyl endopeptidase